jgi:hypothetical protein
MKAVLRVAALLAAVVSWAAPSYSQGGTTSTLSGVVVDTVGA